MKLQRIFGEYVAVSPTEEEISGALEVPGDSKRPYDLGVIQAVGNGHITEKSTSYDRPIHRKAGETIVFSIPDMVIKHKSFVFDTEGKEKVLIIHQGDILASISGGRRVDIETFKVAGEFVLLEWFQTNRIAPDSKIQLPDNVSAELRRLRFTVKQIGEMVFFIPKTQQPDEPSFKIGDEVMVDRMRCTPIQIADPLDKQGGILLIPKTQDYVYVHRNDILGVV